MAPSRRLADVYGYDVAERLSQAQVGVHLTSASGSGQSLYGRQYNYHQSGLDYLVSMSFSGGATNPPPFATNWPSHDNFLQPTVIDGFTRGNADPMGNVSKALLWVRPAGVSVPQPVQATFQHDGLGRLISVTLTNGVTIFPMRFQQGDLRFGRNCDPKRKNNHPAPAMFTTTNRVCLRNTIARAHHPLSARAITTRQETRQRRRTC